MCSPSKVAYCNYHNYEYLDYRFKDVIPYGPTWARVFAIEKFLVDYDYLLYLDTDTIIRNLHFKIEDFICEKNLVVGRMPDYKTHKETHTSTSAILIKNCAWSFDFLKLWQDQKQFIDKPYYAEKSVEHFSTLGTGGLYFEQSAFHYLYDTNDDVKLNTIIKDKHWLNDRDSINNHKSFLIHFASNREPKEERIMNFLRWNIKHL